MAWSRNWHMCTDGAVIPYNLPYLIGLLQFTVQTNYIIFSIASELNALTVAQAAPRLVVLSRAYSVESLSYFLVLDCGISFQQNCVYLKIPRYYDKPSLNTQQFFSKPKMATPIENHFNLKPRRVGAAHLAV